MTIPIITHNHDGIRINIDGVVSCFANAVYLAEAHARHVVTARDCVTTVQIVAEHLARDRNRITQLMVTHDDLPEQVKQFLHDHADHIDSLSAAVADMARKVG